MVCMLDRSDFFSVMRETPPHIALVIAATIFYSGGEAPLAPLPPRDTYTYNSLHVHPSTMWSFSSLPFWLNATSMDIPVIIHHWICFGAGHPHGGVILRRSMCKKKTKCQTNQFPGTQKWLSNYAHCTTVARAHILILNAMRLVSLSPGQRLFDRRCNRLSPVLHHPKGVLQIPVKVCTYMQRVHTLCGMIQHIARERERERGERCPCFSDSSIPWFFMFIKMSRVSKRKKFDKPVQPDMVSFPIIIAASSFADSDCIIIIPYMTLKTVLSWFNSLIHWKQIIQSEKKYTYFLMAWTTVLKYSLFRLSIP